MADAGRNSRDSLDIELDHWFRGGRQPRFFLRDDDAGSDTKALRRLITLCNAHDAPLLLAAVPKYADAALGRLVRSELLMTGAVHGYAHVSHSPAGEKPCEFSRRRSAEAMLAEMQEARETLDRLFGEKLSAILVPPWNRIHDEAVPLAADSGFRAISSHGWPGSRAHGENGGPLPRINTHVDIIHWSSGGTGRHIGWVIDEVARNLGVARRKGWQTIGILTHHRNHDARAWNVLDQLFRRLAEAKAQWLTAEELLRDTGKYDQ
jgi:hypothetical protein